MVYLLYAYGCLDCVHKTKNGAEKHAMRLAKEEWSENLINTGWTFDTFKSEYFVVESMKLKG